MGNDELKEALTEHVELPRAIEIFTTALKEDPGLWEGYKANIAMSFYDEALDNYEIYDKESEVGVVSKETIHHIANQAAERFLNLLCYNWNSATSPLKK